MKLDKSLSRPQLYIFTISHYCEKASWALDYLGVEHDVRVLAPGTHLQVAQSLGLKRGSVPFLTVDDTVIQGSDEIITWADEKTSSGLNLSSDNASVLEVEQRLDDKLGVHIRRWFYSEAIPECPTLVKPIFMHDISTWERFKLSVKWPTIRKLMIQRMDLGYDQGLESLAIVKEELDWLETLIESENSFLVGDQFSRADIAAASLLAPLVAPKEYRCSSLMTLPPRALQESLPMRERVFWPWVLQQYENFRASSEVNQKNS